jgi:hypothetical protein
LLLTCLTTEIQFPNSLRVHSCFVAAECIPQLLLQAWQPDQSGLLLCRKNSVVWSKEIGYVTIWRGEDISDKTRKHLNYFLDFFLTKTKSKIISFTFPILLLFLQEMWSFWPFGGLSKDHEKLSSNSGLGPVDTTWKTHKYFSFWEVDIAISRKKKK